MKRFLITGMTEKPGGIESYIMTLYRRLDHSELQFDFINNTPFRLAYEDEIRQAGGRIIPLTGRRRNPAAHYFDYARFYRRDAGKYAGIYCNLMSLSNIDDLRQAARYGIPMRIVHSHCASDGGCDDSLIRRALHHWHQKEAARYATERFACSEAAGKWMFGAEAFRFIPNAIDLKKYDYNEALRAAVRKELKAKDTTLILGTAGRLETPKNPLFMVEVFAEFLRLCPEALFLHLGEGSLKEQMEAQIKRLGVAGKYLLLGSQLDAGRYYQAMDGFLFPSRSEGFGIALLEAQAAGLLCFLSEQIPQEAQAVPELCHVTAVRDGAGKWAAVIAGEMKRRGSRCGRSWELRRQGYDSETEAKKMEALLLRGNP